MRVFLPLIVLAALCVFAQSVSWSQASKKDGAGKEVQDPLAGIRAKLERIGVVHALPERASGPGGPTPVLTEPMGELPSGEERYEILDAVEEELRRVMEAQPSAEAYHLLGVTRLLQLDPDRAASAFRTALELEGPSQERYNHLITALIEANRLDDAHNTAEEYIRAFPKDELQGLSMLCNISLYAMDAQAMEKAAQRMLKLDPNNLDALITLASAEAVRGDWEEAERKFQAIASRHPEIEEELELLKERLFVLQP